MGRGNTNVSISGFYSAGARGELPIDIQLLLENLLDPDSLFVCGGSCASGLEVNVEGVNGGQC